MVDIEIGLARAFGWSLYEVDLTDIGSLIPFVLRASESTTSSLPKSDKQNRGGRGNVRRVFCDQVNL